MGKLQRVSAQLVELSPEQGAPFQQRWQEAEEQYCRVRERVRQAAAVLEDCAAALQPGTRMDLLLECLERLQSRLQSQPSVRGDTAHLREQIRENSLALGELEKLGVALETVQAQGAELLAPRGTPGRAPSLLRPAGIQERTAQLLSQWGRLRGRCEEQERWLRELLALADRFWHGLSELALTLSDTQQLVLGLEEPPPHPQALREEIDSLQGELDTLGILGVELMSSCGDPDKPDVTKSLDDVSALAGGLLWWARVRMGGVGTGHPQSRAAAGPWRRGRRIPKPRGCPWAVLQGGWVCWAGVLAQGTVSLASCGGAG
uniref:Microtubule-actin cross-linking factor 1 n=1 Tax=Anas platyrhynchos TaxID=8839 RepID=A0A8B9SY49_ANAPL